MAETAVLAAFPHEPMPGVRMRVHHSAGPDGATSAPGWARCRWCTYHMSFSADRPATTCPTRQAWAGRQDRERADAEQAARDAAIVREDAALAAAEDADAARRATWQDLAGIANNDGDRYR